MLIVVSSFMVGIVLGAAVAAKMSPDDGKALYEQVNQGISSANVYKSFLKSLSLEFKSFLVLFFCGIAVVGAPAAVFFIGIKGYAIGFTVGFFIKCFGLAGVLASIGGVFPHYLILVPAFMAMGVICINFSNKLLLGERNLKENLKVYVVKSLLTAVLVFIGCIIEGFVSYFALKIIFNLLK